MSTGKLFVLDGVDGCGKTTTTDLLRDKLQEKYGDKAVVFHMPGATDLGVELRRVVKSSKYNISPFAERLVFAADARQTMDEIVLPALAAGKVVLSERWANFTDYAYGLARGMKVEEILRIHKINPVPKIDCLFVFNQSFETILRRKLAMLSSPNEKHDRFETLAGSDFKNVKIDETFLKKVHGFYEEATKELSDNFPAQAAHECADKVVKIDATEEARTNAANIFKTIVEIVG